MQIPLETIEAFQKALLAARQAVLRPPPDMSVPEWADQYRRLSTSSGAVGGRWNTERVEVARGPMMAVTEPGIRTITVMASTQTLKTSLLENVTGYFIHLDPGPLMVVQPKDDSVEAFSKERISPMVKATPVLRELMGDSRSRTSNNTIDHKTFPGGFLAMVSAGSPSNLAMRAIKFVGLDEVDKYAPTKEGDAVKLAEERMATFRHNSLSIRVCSPTLEETSRIARSYREGDMRRAFGRCPHCEEWIALDFFKHVHWDKTKDGLHLAETAAIYCDRCGCEWTETDRLRMSSTKGLIRHYQTRPFYHCGEEQSPEENRLWEWDAKHEVGYSLCKHCGERGTRMSHASFQVSKLFSPFKPLAELVADWLDCQDDIELKQVFYNTQLGLPFKSSTTRELRGNVLMDRLEIYPDEVPEGVAVLTAGIDVQSAPDNSVGRIELEVVGWGPGYESWSIDTKVFPGDMAKPGVWNELDEYLKRPFRHELGVEMHIMAACVDSGGHSHQDVYNFARVRYMRNIWAIKGNADRGGQWSPIWPAAQPHKKFRTGYKPVMIGVNMAKEVIRQRLVIEQHGPGFCHFPEGRPEAWFDQLTAETLMTVRKGGVTVRKWHCPRGRANEALDCRVYAYAALVGLEQVRKFNLDKHALTVRNFAEAAKSDSPKTPRGRRVRRNTWV